MIYTWFCTNSNYKNGLGWYYLQFIFLYHFTPKLITLPRTTKSPKTYKLLTKILCSAQFELETSKVNL